MMESIKKEVFTKALDQLKRKSESSGDMSHPLDCIFQDCLAQVTDGKGSERHGNGKSFIDQPWKYLADTHGVGFLTGQAAKKLGEAQGMSEHSRWEREMFGVVVYAAMAILYRKRFEEDNG